MADYIDKDELYKTIRAKMLSCDTDTDYGRGIQQGFDFAMSDIRLQPAADVVEIIRCKDCVHYNIVYGYCKYMNTVVHGNNYCSYGEARKNDTH